MVRRLYIYISTEDQGFNDPKIWYINGKNITDDVEQWMKKNKITYPFSDENLILFKERFLK